MLLQVFRKLDQWVEKKKRQDDQSGARPIRPFIIRVLGQVALLEAKVDLDLTATQDVDAFLDCDHSIQKKFSELLGEFGKHWDALSHEIWMPEETKYDEFYQGKTFKALLAKPEYVLISKALKAPEKNKNLVIEYLAKAPSPLFLQLAKKYKIPMDAFVL